MRVNVKVHGVVQGVGFRFFCQRNARQLNLKGYVKNLPDGTVELVAEGEKESLEQFLKLLQRGPALARVDKVEVSWDNVHTKAFEDFHIH